MAVLLALNFAAQLMRRAGESRSQDADAIIVSGLGTVLLGGLYILMLRGADWARDLLGLLTLPAGLLILWPRSAREFTDPQYAGTLPAEKRSLR